MNIEAIIANINNTIAGKELLREKFYNLGQQTSSAEVRFTMRAMVDFLDSNLAELGAIKRDLELCIKE